VLNTLGERTVAVEDGVPDTRLSPSFSPGAEKERGYRRMSIFVLRVLIHFSGLVGYGPMRHSLTVAAR
jgi:hypothetical protein